MIEVSAKDSSTFLVTVSGKVSTTHSVTLSPSYHTRLTSGKIPPEELVRLSFEFLLKRESNSSILSEFDLPVISRYFPEFETEMKKIALP